MATGLPYRIRFTDPTLPGKDQFTIDPNTTDGPLTPTTNSPDSSATGFHTSIVLPGMGLPQYGSRVAESLVHMLEHFAGNIEPVAPTIGQIWYHYDAQTIKVWDGEKWAFIGALFFDVASQDEYNALVGTINRIIGTPTGSTTSNVYGYNQQQLPTVTKRPEPADWARLLAKIQVVRGHEGASIPTLTQSDFRLYGNNQNTYGLATLLRWYNEWVSAVSTLENNRLNVDPTTLETYIPPGSTSTRTTAWNRTIQHQLVLTFSSDAHMRAYFNTGGTVNFSAALNNTSTTLNQEWVNLFNSMGTIKIGAFKVQDNIGPQNGGFYSLADNVEKEIFYRAKTNHSGVYGANIVGYHILAKKNVASKTLTLTVKMVNGPDSGVYAAPGNVTGTIQSAMNLTKVSPLYINNPEVMYPNVVASLLLTQGGTGPNPTPDPEIPVTVSVTYEDSMGGEHAIMRIQAAGITPAGTVVNYSYQVISGNLTPSSGAGQLNPGNGYTTTTHFNGGNNNSIVRVTCTATGYRTTVRDVEIHITSGS